VFKLADNIITIFELAFGALGVAVWASTGFPYWKPVAACALLIAIGIVAHRLIASRQP